MMKPTTPVSPRSGMLLPLEETEVNLTPNNSVEVNLGRDGRDTNGRKPFYVYKGNESLELMAKLLPTMEELWLGQQCEDNAERMVNTARLILSGNAMSRFDVALHKGSVKIVEEQRSYVERQPGESNEEFTDRRKVEYPDGYLEADTVRGAVKELVSTYIPSTTYQNVKRWYISYCNKPESMSFRDFHHEVERINRALKNLPPNFDEEQGFSHEELNIIIIRSTPNEWKVPLHFHQHYNGAYDDPEDLIRYLSDLEQQEALAQAQRDATAQAEPVMQAETAENNNEPQLDGLNINNE